MVLRFLPVEPLHVAYKFTQDLTDLASHSPVEYLDAVSQDYYHMVLALPFHV